MPRDPFSRSLWERLHFLDGFEALAGMLLNVGAITLEDWGGAGEWCHESAALDMRGMRGGNVAWLEIKCGAYNRLGRYWTTKVSFSSSEQQVELLSLDPERRSLREAHLLAARYYGPAADIWSSEEVQLGLFVISGPEVRVLYPFTPARPSHFSPSPPSRSSPAG